MKSFVDKEVLCKRDQSHGIVVAQTNTSITIESAGVSKEISWSTFTRWYKVVDEDSEADDKEALKKAVAREQAREAQRAAEVTTSDTEPVSRRKKLETATNEGDEEGVRYRASFFQMINSNAACLSDKIDIIHKPETKQDIVKCNGRNIFECTLSKKKYTILCHPDSLAPETLKRATKIFPKEWGWALRAQFVIDSADMATVIRAVVNDGMYFRSKDKPAV